MFLKHTHIPESLFVIIQTKLTNWQITGIRTWSLTPRFSYKQGSVPHPMDACAHDKILKRWFAKP